MIEIKNDRLKEFLNFKRWNNSELARALSFSESYVSLILNSEREPSREFMERLVSITGLSLDDLFFCSKTYQNVGNNDLNLQKSSKVPVKPKSRRLEVIER